MSIRKSTDVGLEIRTLLMAEGKYLTDLAADIDEEYNYVFDLVSGRRNGMRGETAQNIKRKINDYFGEELYSVIEEREPVNA